MDHNSHTDLSRLVVSATRPIDDTLELKHTGIYVVVFPIHAICRAYLKIDGRMDDQ